jgi:hypothetical protein
MSAQSSQNHKRTATRQCIKVTELRKKFGSEMTLRDWLSCPENVYTGRPGRVFINKVYFGYPGSKWANPFKISSENPDESRHESLRLYREHITKKIAENPEEYNLDELRGRSLGCFCKPNESCHTDVLLELLK